MDKTVPAGAALLLAFIAGFESEGRYDVIFGHHEDGLSKPITDMTLDELAVAQKGWGRKWGSSAAGRYQMMPTTLAGLRKVLKLTGRELFSPGLQDRLAYHLLKQRGYVRFKAKTITVETFARNLAMEWASLPVLVACQGAHRRIAAGETYYAGDRLNRALVSPVAFRASLAKMAATKA